MDAAAEIGRNPVVSKHHTQGGTGVPNPSRETKFSGANGDRVKNIYIELTMTSRIGNLTRSVFTLFIICDDHTYIIHGSDTLFGE